jgi:hypothetical protein
MKRFFAAMLIFALLLSGATLLSTQVYADDPPPRLSILVNENARAQLRAGTDEALEDLLAYDVISCNTMQMIERAFVSSITGTRRNLQIELLYTFTHVLYDLNNHNRMVAAREGIEVDIPDVIITRIVSPKLAGSDGGFSDIPAGMFYVGLIAPEYLALADAIIAFTGIPEDLIIFEVTGPPRFTNEEINEMNRLIWVYAIDHLEQFDEVIIWTVWPAGFAASYFTVVVGREFDGHEEAFLEFTGIPRDFVTFGFTEGFTWEVPFYTFEEMEEYVNNDSCVDFAPAILAASLAICLMMGYLIYLIILKRSDSMD